MTRLLKPTAGRDGQTGFHARVCFTANDYALRLISSESYS